MTAAQKAQLADRLKAKGILTTPPPTAAAIGTALAMGVTDGRPGNSPLYIRGEIDDPGPLVPRGFLTVLTPGSPPAISASQSGRRELADWLASKSNPLTARVMVNRVWLNLSAKASCARRTTSVRPARSPRTPRCSICSPRSSCATAGR